MNLGILGTGIAMVITNFTTLAFNVTYTYFLDDIKDAVFMPDKRIFSDLTRYFKLGIP